MKKSLSVLGLLAGICLVTAPANAYVTIFSDDFESGSFNSGWSMNKVVYSSAGLNTGSNNQAPGAWLGGWYPGTLFGPNAVATGEGGLLQGNYQGKVWPDYDGWAGDWANHNIVTVSLLHNHVITADDIANGGYQMDLNYKFQPTVGAGSGAFAFAGLFNSDFSQNWWNNRQVLSFNGGNWSASAVRMDLNDPGAIGANLQFGVTVYAQDYSANGLYVDNVTISNVPEPSSVALISLGMAGLLALRLRRKV